MTFELTHIVIHKLLIELCYGGIRSIGGGLLHFYATVGQYFYYLGSFLLLGFFQRLSICIFFKIIRINSIRNYLSYTQFRFRSRSSSRAFCIPDFVYIILYLNIYSLQILHVGLESVQSNPVQPKLNKYRLNFDFNKLFRCSEFCRKVCEILYLFYFSRYYR